ncbi:hypothetical protein [Roseomonas chloroacetimidivorans]|uniref:hypothetical protein n=1 Tax=Roseomonas chloroacetimidivorans TaxID=1766656 RepID=UPI003C768764
MRLLANGTQVTNLPTPSAAVGTPGYFTGGDPGAGQQASIVDQDFLNILLDEFRNLIEGAGLTLDATGLNRAQIRAALDITIIRAANAATDVAYNPGAGQDSTSNGGTVLGSATLPAGHRRASISANVYIGGATTADTTVHLGIFYRLQGSSSWIFLEGQSDTKPAGKLMSMSRWALTSLDPTQAYDFAAFLMKDTQTGVAAGPSGTISIQGFH